MARQKREWHPDFIAYMEFIAHHPNYADMPDKFDENGKIKWVKPGKSYPNLTRWWDEKVKELGVNDRASVARIIHPNELKGLKPCQVCGKKLSIFYIYPNKNTLKKINQLSNENFHLYNESIYEIVDSLNKKNKSGVIRNIFKIPTTIEIQDFKEFIKIHFVNKSKKGQLSPGVMSNPPDRLDGFHTYNACCRSVEDTGRHKENLSRYTQDRRAYENWAEGNYNLANRLMGEFQKYKHKVQCPVCGRVEKMTADHIGPISLGFTHRPKFNPMCSSCNSGKNNRMTLSDVKLLILEENNDEKIVSWHSKHVWNSLKNQIKTDIDALNLSKIMRLHLHNVLILLSIISEKGHDEFLKTYLKPEYSFYDHKFKNFDPLNLTKLEVITKEYTSKNKESNAERYIRISFEELENYKKVENRKTENLMTPEMDDILMHLYLQLEKRDINASKEIMEALIKRLSSITTARFSQAESVKFIEID